MTASGSPRSNFNGQSSSAGEPARVAIDLGAESCRVSLLRWTDGEPAITLIHRIPNSPVHNGNSLCWPLDTILAGLDEGLRKAAEVAPEGIASIAVDGWAVDYVRLDSAGQPLRPPFCYRDERTVAAKQFADQIASPAWMFRHTGAQPLRINTVYQLLADKASGVDTHTPIACLPEYVLHRLGGRRVAEYTNATHTGLIDLETGDWSAELLELFGLPGEALPPIVRPGAVVGKVQGPLAELQAFRNTDLIVPACHDTASAIAGVTRPLDRAAYICSGTWSLVGALVSTPITAPEAADAGFTNQGAVGGKFCFHTNVNGMWILKQCLDHWAREGRPQDLESLIKRAEVSTAPGVIPVDAPPLLLDGNMPALINEQLRIQGLPEIPDLPGNEPIVARTIFESLAHRYARVLLDLEGIVGHKFEKVYILGGGSRNSLLTRLTAEQTALPVETGHAESSTIGNFAVQLAASRHPGKDIPLATLVECADRLCRVG